MKFGVCTGPENAGIAAAAGFDFIEINVQGNFKPFEVETVFSAELDRIRNCALPCAAANCFLPGDLKLTGPSQDSRAVEAYVQVALERASRAGVKTIVFGSGGARNVAEGYNRDDAFKQLLAFGNSAAEIAISNNLTIVVEPLNKSETNVLNTIEECAEYVVSVNKRSLRLLLDTFHFDKEHDSLARLERNFSLVNHIHVATFPGRLPPSEEPYDLSRFAKVCERGCYAGTVSIESPWKNLSAQAPRALEALKKEFC